MTASTFCDAISLEPHMCECNRPDERDNPHRHELDIACLYWQLPDSLFRLLAEKEHGTVWERVLEEVAADLYRHRMYAAARYVRDLGALAEDGAS